MAQQGHRNSKAAVVSIAAHPAFKGADDFDTEFAIAALEKASAFVSRRIRLAFGPLASVSCLREMPPAVRKEQRVAALSLLKAYRTTLAQLHEAREMLSDLHQLERDWQCREQRANSDPDDPWPS